MTQVDKYVQPRHQSLKIGDHTDGMTFLQSWEGRVVKFGVGTGHREVFAIVRLDVPIDSPDGGKVTEIAVRTL